MDLLFGKMVSVDNSVMGEAVQFVKSISSPDFGYCLVILNRGTCQARQPCRLE
jgi:hypothetical protein